MTASAHAMSNVAPAKMSYIDRREAVSPRVSVVTIFFNGERYLTEAIDSVLAQDFADCELILVDDGSSDGSTAIALDYMGRYPGRVKYLDHPEHANRGMSASRNRGIAAAQGEYIAFIDADDVWSPNKLSEQFAIMDANPRLGLVCGTVRYWRSWDGGKDILVPTGHVRDRLVEPPESTLALYPLGTAAAPCPSDLLIRSDLLRSLGGFEEHFTGSRQMYEDQASLAKLYLAAPTYFSSRVWLNYRQHTDSCVASVKREGAYHEVRRYFLNWFEQYLADSPSPADDRVVAALNRALDAYHHPWRHSISVAPSTISGALGFLKKRLGARARLLLGRAMTR
jgi:glycosyltransferase involved in cell wall biosynthesis